MLKDRSAQIENSNDYRLDSESMTQIDFKIFSFTSFKKTNLKWYIYYFCERETY